MINLNYLISDNNLIEKIADNLNKTMGGMLSNTVRTKTDYHPNSVSGFKIENTSGRNLQATIVKSRNKADLQPLHANSNIIGKPTDLDTQAVASDSSKGLSHLKDNRILKPIKKLFR